MNANSCPRSKCEDSTQEMNVDIFEGVTPSNAREASLATLPICVDMSGLLKRFMLDTGNKVGEVGDVRNLAFEKKWNSLMEEKGVRVSEHKEAGTNIVKVEHRPAWDVNSVI